MWIRIVVTVLLFSVTLFAKPGDLDLGFGGNGIVTTEIGSSNDIARSVAIQSDGKIVVAGHGYNIIKDDFALVRYNPDGSLDRSFGSNGIVTTAVGSNSNHGHSVAIQSDEKIVAAGWSYNGINKDFALVRYNPNGSLDESFGSAGIVTTAIGSDSDYAQSVAIQSNGKIVVAGYSRIGINNDFALVCYNPNGSLDSSFGSAGIVTTSIGSGNAYAQSVAIQSDGKIVVTGYSSNDGYIINFTLVRYNPDGSLNTSFGSGGIVTTEVGKYSSYAKSVIIQSDGKIVAAGNSNSNDKDDFALVRYNPDGSLDSNFGSAGIVTTAIGSSSDIANSVAIQSNGKIVAAGYSDNNGNNDFALVRYNPDGSLDTGFSSDGIVTTAIGSSGDIANSVAIQADGKIVAVGYSYNGIDEDFALVRYYGDPIILTPIYYLLQ